MWPKPKKPKKTIKPISGNSSLVLLGLAGWLAGCRNIGFPKQLIGFYSKQLVFFKKNLYPIEKSEIVIALK